MGDIAADRAARSRDLECTHAERRVDVLVTTSSAAVAKLDPSAAHLDRTAIPAVVPVHAHVVAAELDRRIAPFEQVDHREMGDDPGRADAAGLDASKPDVAGRPLVRIVAHRVRQHVEQLVATERLTDLLQEISRTGGVPHDLNRLESGDVVEEPAAGRVHEHEVPLRLEQREGLDERLVGVALHPSGGEVRDGGRAEHHRHVFVSCAPRVDENLRAAALEHFCSVIPHRSNASRSGVRQRWFHPGPPPVWHPQSSRHRATPCTQDHALSRIATWCSAGCSVITSASTPVVR